MVKTGHIPYCIHIQIYPEGKRAPTSNGRTNGTALSNATRPTMTSFGANPVETVLGGDVALLDAVVEGFYGAGDAQRVRFFLD